MPNNFIFSSAQGSKTQMYGSNSGALTPVSVDGTGQMRMSITDVVSVTVTNTPSVNVDNTADVSVVNTPGVSVLNTPEVSVSNTPGVSVLNTPSVNVDNTADVSVVNTPGVSVLNVPSVSVSNTPSVNVDNTADVSVVNTPGVSVLNVPSVSVSNTPSVNVDNTADVSVVNTPGISVLNIPSIEIHSVAATAESIAVTTGTGASDTLTEDTSQQKEYSFYVSNLSTEATMSLALQIAPVDTDSYYVNDSSVVALAPQAITVLVPLKYLDYTRLSYDTGTYTANFIAYYNAKV